MGLLKKKKKKNGTIYKKNYNATKVECRFSNRKKKQKKTIFSYFDLTIRKLADMLLFIDHESQQNSTIPLSQWKC